VGDVSDIRGRQPMEMMARIDAGELRCKDLDECVENRGAKK
jgi:hypothetical protein